MPEGEVYEAVESPVVSWGATSSPTGAPSRGGATSAPPSFANLQALPIMMADSLVADTVATIASLDPVMGDVDR